MPTPSSSCPLPLRWHLGHVFHALTPHYSTVVGISEHTAAAGFNGCLRVTDILSTKAMVFKLRYVYLGIMQHFAKDMCKILIMVVKLLIA